MLELEYKFYKEHLQDFLKDHLGQFVVIQGGEAKGFYPTEADALESMAGQELGTFLVKQCLPFEQTIVDYHSRAIFV